MIKLISREEVFYRSTIVDHYISDRQKNWHAKDYERLIEYYEEKSIQMEEPFDHTEAFHNDQVVLDDFAVLGYIDKGEMNHLTNRSIAFTKFFELMGIHQLYLLDMVKCDWIYFPYKSFEKRETIKQIVSKSDYCEAFELDIDELSKVLPLFNFSGRFNMEIFYLFPANTDAALAMFACDDRNFHTIFPATDREKISKAAFDSNLVMGGVEVCSMKY